MNYFNRNWALNVLMKQNTNTPIGPKLCTLKGTKLLLFLAREVEL